MIIGVGVDLVDLERFEKAISGTPALVERLFAESEREASTRTLAGRFAAKEAIAKALGTGIGHGVSFQDMQISNDEKGAPQVHLSGGAAAVMHSRGGRRVLLSLADERDYAVAYAILSE